MNRLRGVGVICLGLVALAPGGSGSAAPPADEARANPVVKPSTQRTLRLPEKPDHYADLDLPPAAPAITRAAPSSTSTASARGSRAS
jgi:hypothetical protein